MGFQTLAIEQRAVEVWRVLGAVKTELGKFGEVLDKVKRQLETASRTIDETGVRRRAMEKKLRAVEQLPEAESELMLELTAADGYGPAAADEALWPGADLEPRPADAAAEDDATV